MFVSSSSSITPSNSVVQIHVSISVFYRYCEADKQHCNVNGWHKTRQACQLRRETNGWHVPLKRMAHAAYFTSAQSTLCAGKEPFPLDETDYRYRSWRPLHDLVSLPCYFGVTVPEYLRQSASNSSFPKDNLASVVFRQVQVMIVPGTFHGMRRHDA